MNNIPSHEPFEHNGRERWNCQGSQRIDSEMPLKTRVGLRLHDHVITAMPPLLDERLRQTLSFHRHFLSKKDLWKEVSILSTVIYKNKNQHRRAGYFRALEKTLHLLRSLETHPAGQSLSKLAELVHAQCPSVPCATCANVPAALESSRVQIQLVLKLNAELLDTLDDAAIKLSGLIASSYFMPLALTSFALVGRIRVFALAMQQDAQRSNELLEHTAAKVKAAPPPPAPASTDSTDIAPVATMEAKPKKADKRIDTPVKLKGSKMPPPPAKPLSLWISSPPVEEPAPAPAPKKVRRDEIDDIFGGGPPLKKRK